MGAQGVGCISRGGIRVFSGHPGRKRRSSGRHKWRPYVFCAGGCGLRRRSVRLGRVFSGVARRGAIYDARCPWGHKVSAAFRAAASAFFAAFRVVSPVIRASQVAPLRFLCRRLWVAASLRAFSVAVVDCRIVGTPFMTPGARGGTRCRLHFARRHPRFLQHSGWFRRSSGRHKWRPYVFCAGGCGLRRRVIWPTCGGCSRGRASDNFP